MKASEMTNEELAKELLSRVPLDSNSHDVLRVAAARLRTFTLLSKAHQRLANDSVDCESDLLRKLKVAEDALEYAKGSITRDCTNDCDHLQECDGIKGCLCEQRINNALTAIRR